MIVTLTTMHYLLQYAARRDSLLSLKYHKSIQLTRRLCKRIEGSPKKYEAIQVTSTAITRKILSFLSKFTNRTATVIQSKSEAAISSLFTRLKDSASAFDDVLGISEVRNAQENVRRAEDEFMECRKRVQTAKKELDFIHSQLSEVRRRLDRTPRDDERYLTLATEEHGILREEKKLKLDFEEMENLERDHFASLSAVVRDSHEKERARAERTKYWSVLGSVAGASLGIIGSSIVNYIRLKEIKSSVKGTGESLMEKSNELKEILTAQDSTLISHSTEMRNAVLSQNQEISDRLADLRDAVDTYALSASIGSDVGTIEAGISLKTLTSQLRELVQLQLASQRAKIEYGLEENKSEKLNLVDQFRSLHLDVTSKMSDVLSRLELIQNNQINGAFTSEETALPHIANKAKSPTLDAINLGKYAQDLDDAKWWSRIGAIASLSFGAFGVAAFLYEVIR